MMLQHPSQSDCEYPEQFRLIVMATRLLRMI